MEREVSLAQLQAKAQQIEGALQKVEKTSDQLGGPEGPNRLRWDKAFGSERLSRIIRVGDIRGTIEERTKPILRSHLERVQEDINTQTTREEIKTNLARIEQLAQAGRLTTQEVEAAREEARKILGTISFQPAEAKPVKVQVEEEPSLPWQEQELTPYEQRVFSIISQHSTDNPISTTEFSQALYPTEAGQERLLKKRVSVLITRIRPKLRKYGLDIINLMPVGQKGFKNVEGSYYLKDLTEIKPTLPPTQPDKGEKRGRSQESRQKFEMILPDGQAVTIRGKITAEVLKALLSAPNLTLQTDQLTQAVYGGYTKISVRKLFSTVSSLRQVLQSFGFAIDQPVTPHERSRKIMARYTLKKIPVEAPIEKIEKKKGKLPRRIAQVVVFEQKIVALSAILDNPHTTIDEIIKILGPSHKTGRALTRQQAFWALRVRGGVGLLYVRIRTGVANERERDLWTKIKQKTQMEGDKEAFQFFSIRLDQWFDQQKTVTPADIAQVVEVAQAVEVQEPTLEEAAVLSALLLIRNGSVVKLNGSGGEIKLEVEKGVLDALRKLTISFLLQNVQDPNQMVEAYVQSRPPVLEKFRNLIRSTEFEQIFDDIKDENLKSLLLWLYYQDMEQTGQIFLNLLTEQPDFVREFEGTELIRVWKEYRVKTPQIQIVPESVPYIETPPKPKTPIIEKRDPLVRQKIEGYLDELEEHNITEPINGAQLNRIFQRLKASFIDWIELEKRYIKPARGRDGRHPAFKPEEIVLMLYVYDHGQIINLNRGMVSELAQLISEAGQKRAGEKKSQSANGNINHHLNNSK